MYAISQINLYNNQQLDISCVEALIKAHNVKPQAVNSSKVKVLSLS